MVKIQLDKEGLVLEGRNSKYMGTGKSQESIRRPGWGFRVGEQWEVRSGGRPGSAGKGQGLLGKAGQGLLGMTWKREG